ncbi:hypothetical protein MNBD_NITROSPIRAE03-955 [hydrothermal vent metagenome]|uniref:Polyhydroxyalkanoate synthesis regulator phasin n=1 Tax=hydrothermal vent metagenome TaxID=652676 RepID=A0A3B1CV58_9ZZZZ
MTIFDVVRNALLAGFGVQEKIKESIDELVKKGELSETQGAKLVKEWSEKAEKGSDELTRSVSDVLAKTLEKMNLPTKENIEDLNKKIKALSTRVKKLEAAIEGSEQKGT